MNPRKGPTKMPQKVVADTIRDKGGSDACNTARTVFHIQLMDHKRPTNLCIRKKVYRNEFGWLFSFRVVNFVYYTNNVRTKGLVLEL